jgi:DNA polymerase III alpha subunit (gram-positive type)
VCDVETTGLDVESGHEITELAAIALNAHDFEPHHAGRFQVFIKPKNLEIVSAGAVKVAKESYEKAMTDGVDAKVAMRHFMEFCNKVNDKQLDSTRPYLAGHNCPFDYKFINVTTKRCNLIKSDKDAPWHYHFIDTLPMMFCLFESDPTVNRWNLDTLLGKLNMRRSGTTHGAMEDVELTAEALRRMLKFFRTASKKMKIS